MTRTSNPQSWTRNAYVIVHAPDCSRADRKGHALEHVAIVERVLRKPLPPRAEIHHADLDRGNNRPGNLVVCQDKSYHRLLHLRTAARAAGYPLHYRVCARCGHFDAPAHLTDPGGCHPVGLSAAGVVCVLTTPPSPVFSVVPPAPFTPGR
jgi:hypothetical protein